MRVGDFLQAMEGYREAELERMKSTAELIRISTALLWNTQVKEEDRLTASRLWPFPWERKTSEEPESISEEERKKIDDAQAEILNKHFPG
jgi:hypothetical protein